MKPGKLDLPTIWRGCNYGPVRISWTDDNGNPINLSGWTPKAYSRYFQFNARITDAAHGLTTVLLPIQATQALKLGVTDWDFIWTQTGAPNTNLSPFLKGKVEIKDPVTDPQTHVMGRIGGGSNYNKMFVVNQQPHVFISLIGRYHQTFAPPGQTPVPIRPLAREQMAQMVANGQTKITILVTFYHAYLQVPDPAQRVALEYILVAGLIPWNPSGIEGDTVVRLTNQQTQNVSDLLADVNEAGFTQVNIRFQTLNHTSVTCWYNNDLPCANNPENHVWRPDRYFHNKNYIFSIIPVIEANKGDLSVIYDLGLETATKNLEAGDGDESDVRRQYVWFLWRDYLARFGVPGRHASMAFSFIGQSRTNTVGTRYSRGLVAMLSVFHSHGLAFPGHYGMDHYDGVNSLGENTMYGLLVDNHDYLKRTYPGEEHKPLILQEIFYNDATTAFHIERALGHRPGLNLHSIFQWPTIRGFGPGNYVFPDGYPRNFTNYHTL